MENMGYFQPLRVFWGHFGHFYDEYFLLLFAISINLGCFRTFLEILRSFWTI